MGYVDLLMQDDTGMKLVLPSLVSVQVALDVAKEVCDTHLADAADVITIVIKPSS